MQYRPKETSGNRKPENEMGDSFLQLQSSGLETMGRYSALLPTPVGASVRKTTVQMNRSCLCSLVRKSAHSHKSSISPFCRSKTKDEGRHFYRPKSLSASSSQRRNVPNSSLKAFLWGSEWKGKCHFLKYFPLELP